MKIWHLQKAGMTCALEGGALTDFRMAVCLPPNANLTGDAYQLLVEKEDFDRVVNELNVIKAERDRVASGKTECADCGSLLARF